VAIYVTDTHPLIWYSSGAYRKLSPKARRLFDRAGHAEVLIRVPAMAVWEAGLLEKKSRLPRRQPQVQETSGYCAHAGKIIMIIMPRQGSALMWFFTVWSLLQENCVSKKMTTVNVRTNQRSLRLNFRGNGS